MASRVKLGLVAMVSLALASHAGAKGIWILTTPDVPGERHQLEAVARHLGTEYKFISRLSASRCAAALAGEDRPSVLLFKGGGENERRALELRESKGVFVVKFAGRRYDPRAFDLVVSLASHGGADAANVLKIPTAPSLITPSPRTREPAKPKLVLLLGGHVDPARRPFTKEHFASLRARIAAWVQETGGSVVALGSRRTPEHFTRELLDLAAVVPWRGWSGENPYARTLGDADLILVTGDSISMLSDALETGRPTFVFGADLGYPMHRNFVRSLIDRGWVNPAEDMARASLIAVPPPRTSEVVARAIRGRLTPLQ